MYSTISAPEEGLREGRGGSRLIAKRAWPAQSEGGGGEEDQAQEVVGRRKVGGRLCGMWECGRWKGGGWRIEDGRRKVCVRQRERERES